jgi:hypothetical protein
MCSLPDHSIAGAGLWQKGKKNFTTLSKKYVYSITVHLFYNKELTNSVRKSNKLSYRAAFLGGSVYLSH